MALHVFVFLLVVCLLLSRALLWRPCRVHFRPFSSRGGTTHSRAQRLLKPRSPDDCPACRLAPTSSLGVEPAPPSVRPWREVKGRRGAPKRVSTEGLACPNPKCPYFGVTDDQIHAAFWGWQAWSCRADPDLSMPGLPHHVHRQAQHPPIPFENPFSADRNDPQCAGRRAGPIRGLACLRLSAGHHHHLASSRWRTCPDLAPTLLLPSPAPPSPAGRTTHEAP
jgi:hypothetical protein